MIEKKPGVIHVDKLRAIFLMEADFNFINKLIFGQRMLAWANDRKLLLPECFGSIQHRSAGHLALA